tara:strand:- start:230 stop:670 length:441 start_codon:yes stop_codon:yes gene_type:complete
MKTTNNSNHSITIPLTDKQYDLFRRIAKADRRKLKDIYRLVFARGLEFQWCEDHFTFDKKEDEFTPEEKKQLAKNKEVQEELKKKGKRLYELSKEEEIELGYKRVAEHHFVGGYGDEGDVAHLIAEQLRQPLFDEETGLYIGKEVA